MAFCGWTFSSQTETPSRRLCQLFLSSKTFRFLYPASDFSASLRDKVKKVKKLKISSFLFVHHKHLIGGRKQCPLEKQFPDFKRDRTGGKGEGDKNRTESYITTICFIRKHSIHNLYMSVSWVQMQTAVVWRSYIKTETKEFWNLSLTANSPSIFSEKVL